MAVSFYRKSTIFAATFQSSINLTCIHMAFFKEFREFALNGNFIQQCVDFTILVFCVFLMVKFMNRLIRKREAAAPVTPPAPSKEEVLLTEIRDLLKDRQEKK